MNKRATYLLAVATTILVVFTGCATLRHRSEARTTSLYNFLYPDELGRADSPGIPTLSLPLRAGVAFVPDAQEGGPKNLSEAERMALLKKMSAEFKAYPFVKSIEIFPSAYLSPKGGFANLDQLHKMYDVDVIALVSYDQTQFTEKGITSLAYWTVVGTYLIPGEKNDTRTMLDAGVYDIKSRKLLFRAPGLSVVKGRATPIFLPEELREDSQAGFQMAATNLIGELKTQLADFQTRVKETPAEYKVVHKPGYTGAGAFGGFEVALAGAIGLAVLVRGRLKR